MQYTAPKFDGENVLCRLNISADKLSVRQY